MRSFSEVILTSKNQTNPDQNTKFHAEYVEDKMSMVVVRNTVVNPRAMTKEISQSLVRTYLDLLIRFRNASLAPLAMLAPKGLSDHAIDAKMILVKRS